MHNFAATAIDLKYANRAHVLGNPVKHSLSPAIHNAAYNYLNLPYTYSALEVNESDCLRVIEELRNGEILGLSFTMPYKETALAAAEIISNDCTRSRVSNTLVLRDHKIVAENTDIFGITEVLKLHPDRLSLPWYVLGSGATARSTICALHDLNVSEITVVGRDKAKLDWLAEKYDIEVFTWQDNVRLSGNLISTLPASAQSDLIINLDEISFLFDVNYAGWPTVFGQNVSSMGGVVESGLAMLINQAQLQLEIMIGQVVPLSVLKSAVT
jgi:shikimate dehydrogenase